MLDLRTDPAKVPSQDGDEEGSRAEEGGGFEVASVHGSGGGLMWVFALVVVFAGGVVTGGMVMFLRRGPVLMHALLREVEPVHEVVPVVVSAPVFQPTPPTPPSAIVSVEQGKLNVSPRQRRE
ncbi:MAG: hypothetical protein GEV09_27760, partial [Pseudonocardiaceae bacterium]|nr:hypothetical protein [Pseudonocardiaceae bacterium]